MTHSGISHLSALSDWLSDTHEFCCAPLLESSGSKQTVLISMILIFYAQHSFNVGNIFLMI